MPVGQCKLCQRVIDPWEGLCAECRKGLEVFYHREVTRPCERCGTPTTWEPLCYHCRGSRRRRVPRRRDP